MAGRELGKRAAKSRVVNDEGCEAWCACLAALSSLTMGHVCMMGRFAPASQLLSSKARIRHRGHHGNARGWLLT